MSSSFLPPFPVGAAAPNPAAKPPARARSRHGVTPYPEGQTWSFRLRLKGQAIYRAGFATAAEASREAERLRQKILGAGKPKHNGPWHTSLGQALQDYARERLPFMKGAQQDACRINRYLCACGLQTVKVSAAAADKTPTEATSATTYWVVSLRPAGAPRKVPQGLHAHRKRQAAQKAATDRLRRELARTPVAQVMPYQVQELVDAMTRDGYKPPSVGLERSLLRRLFNYMRETWLWIEPGRNPATGLKMLKIDDARDRVLTNAEWKKICEALERGRNPYVAPLLALLLESAMRVSEPLLHATWPDVDWQRCILRLQDGKAGARDVPLNPGAMEVLRVLKAMAADRADPQIIPITYEALRAAWNRACESAGVKGVHIHDLRHTAATRFTLELHGNLPVLNEVGWQAWSPTG